MELLYILYCTSHPVLSSLLICVYPLSFSCLVSCHRVCLSLRSLGGVPGRVLQHVPGPLAAVAQKAPPAVPTSQ